MGRGQWIVVLALAGCDELAGIGTPGPAQTHCVIDGIDLCLNAEPKNPLTLDADLTLNTGGDCTIVHFVPPQPSLCVLYATDVTINARVSATGARPLVIVATGTITVNGTVDVSSYRGMASAGAASPSSACPQPTPPTNRQYAGGAGGSFIGTGGAGGNGYDGEAGQASLPAQSPPAFPRGGCPGGGGGADGTTGGQGSGRGGGAVWLAAGEAIIVNGGGRVLALGAGGGASGGMAGNEGVAAGGGGSGGFIRLGAPQLTIEGVVAANGGGGGEGGEGGANGRAGLPGEDGRPSIEAAKGGTGGTLLGGDGGAGGASATANGADGMNASPTTTLAGGGGGGGGVGFIQLVAEMKVTTGATISPAAQ